MTSPWKPSAALLGAACITFAFCLIIPMLGSVQQKAPSLNADPVQLVPMPPRTRQTIDRQSAATEQTAVVRAPKITGMSMSLPALSLPSDIPIPAFSGPDALSLTLPAAPDPGIPNPTMSAFDQPPRVLARLEPLYPASARRSGTQGQVLVRALVDEQGRVAEVEVVKSEPAGVFDAAALKAVRDWRFSPAKRLGNPVSVHIDIPIRFRLDTP